MPRRPSLTKHLRAIKLAVAEIAESFATVSARVRKAEREAARKSRRTLTITPARRAQLKLQGRYLGYMRQLGPRQKAQVRAVKEKRGFEAAIGVARRMAGRG